MGTLLCYDSASHRSIQAAKKHEWFATDVACVVFSEVLKNEVGVTLCNGSSTSVFQRSRLSDMAAPNQCCCIYAAAIWANRGLVAKSHGNAGIRLMSDDYFRREQVRAFL